MQLHEAVKRARAELGYSRKRLAELAGVQRKQLATLEAGGNVTLATIRKVLAQLPNLESFTIETATGKVTHEENRTAFDRRAVDALQQFATAFKEWIDVAATGQLPGEDVVARIQHATNLYYGNLGKTPEQVDRMRAKLRAEREARHAAEVAETIAALEAAGELDDEVEAEAEDGAAEDGERERT